MTQRINRARQMVTKCLGCLAPMKVNKNAKAHLRCDACRGFVPRIFSGNRVACHVR